MNFRIFYTASGVFFSYATIVWNLFEVPLKERWFLAIFLFIMCIWGGIYLDYSRKREQREELEKKQKIQHRIQEDIKQRIKDEWEGKYD